MAFSANQPSDGPSPLCSSSVSSAASGSKGSDQIRSLRRVVTRAQTSGNDDAPLYAPHGTLAGDLLMAVDGCDLVDLHPKLTVRTAEASVAVGLTDATCGDKPPWTQKKDCVKHASLALGGACAQQ